MTLPVTPTSIPAVAFQVAFFGTRSGVTVSADPNDPTVTPTWTDLTHQLISLSVKRGKSYELDEAQAQEYTFKLRNTDGSLDPTNVASPYYPYVLPFRQFRIQVTISGTTYTAATGYIESWPQTWEMHGAYPYVTCTATDSLATLSQILLPSALSAEILLDNPVGYWPLSEPNGAVMGANITAQTAVPGVSQVLYGTGSSSSVGFGSTTLTALVGAGGASSQAGAAIQGDTTCVALSAADSTVNGVALESHFAVGYDDGGYTVECWFQSLAGHTYTGSITLISTDHVDLVLEASVGSLTVVCPGLGGPVDTAVSVLDGKPHHLAATYQPGGNLVMYVDGSAIKTAAVTAPQNTSLTVTRLGGSSNAIDGYGFGPCSLAHAAVYDTALTATRIAARHTAGVTAFAGEDTGARFSRILRYAAWNGTSIVPAGNNNMLALYDCANKSALQALLEVCTAEQGNMYIDNLGRVVFENRHARMVQITQSYVLGEYATPQPARTNLCPNPSFENDTASWSPGGFSGQPTLAVSTAHSVVGTHSMLITWQAGGSFPEASITMPTTAGQVYTMSCYVWVAPGTGSVALSYAQGGPATIGPGSSVTGAWQRLSQTFTATGTSALISVLGPPTAGTTYVDAALFEQSATVGTYFDGSTVGCSWTGIAGDSTSTAPASSGEIPYEGDIEVNFDPQQVYNTAIVERPGGVVLNLSDPTSVLRYFPRAFPSSPLVLPVSDDATAQNAAQLLLGRYKDPHARVANVKISPTGYPAAWPFALSVQIGQRVGLNRRSPAAPVVNLDLFVESVGHDYDARTGDWETTLELSPAFWQSYAIMTAARATLAASVTAGATTVTITVPNDSAGNTPDQQGWNASAITSLQIVDGANTETVAVSAMTIAANTVTATVAAIANNHAGGVVVAENPGSYTYNQFDGAAAFDGTHQLAY